MRRDAFLVAALVIGQLFWTAAAFGQAARETRLLITVVDQSNSVLPTATVSVAGLEDATRKTTAPPAQATMDGVATISGLVPGRYSVHAEFPGFDPGDLKDVRVRPGDNKHIIILAIR